jgi:capsular exopolysaccharide synthesis family protein
MSKYLNDMQKNNPRTTTESGGADLDIRQILENVKQGTAPRVAASEVRLIETPGVDLENEKDAPLLLRDDHSVQAALEAYRGLRTRLMRVQAKSGVRTIAVTSTVPGEGKTLTVMNLGLCYAQLSNQRVLIIDGDLRTRGLTQLMGNPVVAGLAEVLTGKITPEQAMRSTNQKNLFVIPAGEVASPPPEHFAGPRWQEFLAWCSESFKLVLVDTPPALPLADFELISAACDGVIAVVRAHHAERELLNKTASALDSKKLIGIVFNATDVRVMKYGYEYGYK